MPFVPEGIVEANCFTFKINNFSCHLNLPNQWGLVDLLGQSAKVYAATLTKEEFSKTFLEVRQQKVNELLELYRTPGQEYLIKYIDFQIKMLHESLLNHWRYPALVTRYQGKLIWHTGGTRVMPTAMTHDSPTQGLKLLVTDFDQTDPTEFEKIYPIENDQDLAQILNVEFFRYKQYELGRVDSNLEIFLEWQDTPGPCLHYIKPPNNLLDWDTQGDLVYVPDMLPILHKTLDNKKIYYYCWDEDQLTDTSNGLDLHWMGPDDIIRDNEDLTASVYWHQRFAPQPDGVEIWIKPGRKIDMGEILFWLDQNHNVYIDKHHRFAILFDHSRFDFTEIRLSQ